MDNTSYEENDRLNDDVNIALGEPFMIGGVLFESDCKVDDNNLKTNNGKKEGERLVLSKNGIKKARFFYHKDKLDGLCEFFAEDGKKERELMYENDVQNGWGCEYNDGKIISEGVYQNCRRYSDLVNYTEDARLMNMKYLKEVKDNNILSICQYNSNHKREGLCYLYENNVIKSEVKFENGVEKRKMKEFHNSKMSEFDEEGKVIYIGGYDGSVSVGFKRTGNGETMKYVKGVLNEVVRMKNEKEIGKCVLKGKEMKEYEGNKLMYEGEFSVKNGSVIRNGKGVIPSSSSSSFYVVLFENGEEKRKIQEINKKEMKMTEYDEAGRIVYTGGYGKKYREFIKRRKGRLFEYDGDRRLIYDCDNGKKKGKRRVFHSGIMTEYNEKNQIIYQGEFTDDQSIGFRRYGRGVSYEYCHDGLMKEYEGNKLVYEGKFSEKNGSVIRNGKGVIPSSSSSSFYVVLFENGEEKRKIQEINKNDKKMTEYDEAGRIVYIGGYGKKYREFIKSGEGRLFEYDGDRRLIYDCDNGKKKGKRRVIHSGIMTEYNEKNGIVYEGGYSGNPEDGFVREGEGKEYVWKRVPNSTEDTYSKVYDGNWKNDKRDGQGKSYKETDLLYDGLWREGRPNGHGKTYRNGNLMRDCEWENGYYKRGDIWIWYEDNDKVYIGQWKKDKPHGKGKYVNEKGQVLYEGEWVNGFFHIKGMKWFDYSTGKIATPLQYMHAWLSIEDNRNMWIAYSIIIAIIAFSVCIIYNWGRGVYLDSYQCDVIRSVSKSITELVIPDSGCKNATRFDISQFKELKSIVIGINNFKNVNDVVITSICLLIVD